GPTSQDVTMLQPVLRPVPDVKYPIDVLSFPDLLQLWLSAPLAPRQNRHLRECLCDTDGSLGKVHYETWNPAQRRPLRLPPLRQRLQLFQPSPETLRLLDEMSGGDAYLIYGEVALDQIYPFAEVIYPSAELEQPGKLMKRCIMKRNHRQEMRCFKMTAYTNR